MATTNVPVSRRRRQKRNQRRGVGNPPPSPPPPSEEVVISTPAPARLSYLAVAKKPVVVTAPVEQELKIPRLSSGVVLLNQTPVSLRGSYTPSEAEIQLQESMMKSKETWKREDFQRWKKEHNDVLQMLYATFTDNFDEKMPFDDFCSVSFSTSKNTLPVPKYSKYCC